jgi:predicted RNase H-like nuclease (RuvC/YqgF family)
MDEDMLLQKKEYDKLINERDIIGLQLIHRNDEISLLNEKIRSQEMTIKASEAQYFERLTDIQLLRGSIRDITREHNLTKHSGVRISEMKYKILHLERELLQEKTRVTALSEELENPMNIHRWRKLEGSDPTSFELIQKVQVLQRKLILKTEEVVEKSLIIQEKEALYNELKDLLSHLPGPEINDQINTYQRNILSKNKQLKVLSSEMNMYQAQANEYKYEVERLNHEIVDLKRKYYQQKRKEEIQSASVDSSKNNGSDNVSYNGGYSNGFSSNYPPLNKKNNTMPALFTSNGNQNNGQSRKFVGGGFAIIKQPNA